MTEIEDSPPRRSQVQLQRWLDEFRDAGYDPAGVLTVAPQEDEAEQDTGLVILYLRSSSEAIYIQPTSYDNPRWSLTLTGRDTDLTLSTHGVATYAAELVLAANLCTFLQWKSLEWDRDSGHREHGAAPF